jgi:hypothetical protein
MQRRAIVLVLAAVALWHGPALAASKSPSRAPLKGCTWETLSDAKVGLSVWVQRCDFGFRKIDFLFQNNSLAIRYSDGGAPEPVVDVFDLLPGEKAEAGMRRLFDAHTDKQLAARCVLKLYHGDGEKAPAGVKRYTFLPNAALEKELSAKQDPDEVPDPPCGDWGDAPDGIQYFETHPASGVAKVLFVRVGQDEPLFDEQTLRLLPGAATKASD